MRDLQSFIWRSLRTQDEVLKVYQQGPYDGSVYFLAVPKYSAFRTCNTWGAEALRAAGFRVHAKGVVFAWQLWMQARRLKRSQEQILRPPELPCSAAHSISRVGEIRRLRDAIGRAARFRPGRPPWSSIPAAPPPWFWPADSDCRC